MLRVFLCLLLIFISTTFVFGVEEVVLDTDDDISILDTNKNANVIQLTSENLTLKEKIENIQAREIIDTSKSSYLLEEILTKEFNDGLVKNIHAFGYIRSGINMDFAEDDSDFDYRFSSLNVGINGKFRDDKTYYEARFRFNGQNRYSFLQYMPSNIYIANTTIPHHTVIVGHISLDSQNSNFGHQS